MQVITFQNAPGILSAASVVGQKETNGPLGSSFDLAENGDDRFGKPTWEQAEGEMQRRALDLALRKADLTPDQIGALFAGDLENQCIASAYGLKDFGIPYFGLYGACSTGAEGLILASIALQSEAMTHVAAVTSSHNAAAERQFRFPVEYGGQRAPTAQWTVTGAAALLLNTFSPAQAYITQALPGRIVDGGITDLNNMGAAMAPAAIDTLKRYFEQTHTAPSDFDMILTGDLGAEGHGIVVELMGKAGYDLTRNYSDCGLLIYDRARQDVHAGGSGCGCSVTVLAGYLMSLFRQGIIHDILWMGTGALMSPLAVNQGQSIPGICHLLRITKENLL